MNFIRNFLPLLIVVFFLCACGKQVEVIESHQFKLMADRMPKELIAREILDSSRYYVPATWAFGSKNYGDELYRRLVSDFIFEDVAETPKQHNFAGLVNANPKQNRVHRRANGFSIFNNKVIKSKKSTTSIERQISVDMIAITDWDGDTQNDWLIACKLLRTRGAVPRIYYLVVPNPPVQGPLRAQVIGVYDDLGVVGRLYMRDSVVQSTSPVEDVVPGLKPVTIPPSSNTPTHDDGIKERVLD